METRKQKTNIFKAERKNLKFYIQEKNPSKMKA